MGLDVFARGGAVTQTDYDAELAQLAGINLGVTLPSVLRDGVGISYGGFGAFRTGLCAALGVDLRSLAGFGGKLPPEEACSTHPELWEALLPLIDHSDCDGVLTNEECAQVAPALEEALKVAVELETWRPEPEPGEDDDDIQAIVDYYRSFALEFAKLCRAAADNAAHLVFA